MASIQGPSNVSNPPDGRRQHRRPNFQPMPPDAQPTPTTSSKDPFFGHELIARLCSRFIIHLFSCPEEAPKEAPPQVAQVKLPNFIAYALYRTKLHSAVTFASLVLLQRLKARFPTARGSSGHRLFLSAFMLSSKTICDDTYSNKSWSVVAQGMFTLREINQMEREMCGYLDWDLTVDNPILGEFEKMVKRDFRLSAGPYPTYSLHMVSKRAARAAASPSATPMPPPNTTTSPIPMFGPRQSTPAKDPASPAASSPMSRSQSSPRSPMTPDTPSSSYSNTSSPSSTASPATPGGITDHDAKIQGIDNIGPFSLTIGVPAAHPLKTKMYSFAIPTAW